MDLAVGGALQGPTLLGSSELRSSLQGCCRVRVGLSALLRGTHSSIATYSVLIQGLEPPQCRRHGLSVTSLTSLENQGNRETWPRKQAQIQWLCVC